MNNIALLYINGFAVLVLLLALRNYRQKFKYICCEEKVFIFFILSTMAILIIETALQNLWLQPGPAIHILLYVLQMLDFCLTVVIPMLWLYYCLFRLYHISSISPAARILIAAPAAVFILVVLIALPGGYAFRIDESNRYERGIAFMGSFIVGYEYIAASLILMIAKRKLLNQGELVPYLLVPALPITLGILEATLTSPLGLLWAATSLVILEIQMLVLNNKTNIDHLTSLNNRMALDTYVRRIIHESHSSGKPLGLIMIDIDNFKKINDTFGHPEGDRALKITADVLRECFLGKYFIARYGGDEFTVVLKDCSREMMAGYLQKLDTERARQNKNGNKPYEIMFSVGASVFEQDEITDAHTMLMKVDRIMYKDKNSKKGIDPDMPVD
jgi:diguanylate cyclase (GGDEF)-like protein